MGIIGRNWQWVGAPGEGLVDLEIPEHPKFFLSKRVFSPKFFLSPDFCGKSINNFSDKNFSSLFHLLRKIMTEIQLLNQVT